MANYSQISRQDPEHMQGIRLNTYNNPHFRGSRVSRWQRHLTVDEIPTTNEQAVILYTPEAAFKEDRIHVAQTMEVNHINRWVQYTGGATSHMFWLFHRKVIVVKTAWESLRRVRQGQHTRTPPYYNNYDSTLLCKGEYYWFFTLQNRHWYIVPEDSVMQAHYIDLLKRVVTLEEMAK
jgi:hypothetical protein